MPPIPLPAPELHRAFGPQPLTCLPVALFTQRSITTVFDPCITGTSQQAVSDGYWLMLKPLEAGQHTIHFGSTSWGQDVTYHLTVQ